MSTCSDFGRRQRGDILLEALIGVALTAVIGAGLSQVLSRVLLAQHDTRVEQLAVEQVRAGLQHQGLALCAQGQVPMALPAQLASARATVTCQPGNTDVVFGTQYTASGVAMPPRMQVAVGASGLQIGGPDIAFDTAAPPRNVLVTP